MSGNWKWVPITAVDLLAKVNANPITRDIFRFLEHVKKYEFLQDKLHNVPTDRNEMLAWRRDRIEWYRDERDKSLGLINMFINEFREEETKGRADAPYPDSSGMLVLRHLNEAAHFTLILTYLEAINVIVQNETGHETEEQDAVFLPVPSALHALNEILTQIETLLHAREWSSAAQISLALRTQVQALELLELFLDRMFLYQSQMQKTLRSRRKLPSTAFHAPPVPSVSAWERAKLPPPLPAAFHAPPAYRIEPTSSYY